MESLIINEAKTQTAFHKMIMKLTMGINHVMIGMIVIPIMTWLIPSPREPLQMQSQLGS